MGAPISKVSFNSDDVKKFKRNLYNETSFLKQLFQSDAFNRECYEIGFELELQMLNEFFNPRFNNLQLLKSLLLKDESIKTEAGASCIEVNSKPYTFNEDALVHSRNELVYLWERCRSLGEKKHTNIIAIGTLPSYSEYKYKEKGTLTNEKRYLALDKVMAKVRDHEPLYIHIHGRHDFDFKANTTAIIGTSSAFQVHLRIPQALAARYYNAAQILAAPMVAIGCNSPYLFTDSVWEETRIPLFEKIARSEKSAERNYARVTLGTGYLRDSLFEIFEENLYYPIIMPFHQELSVEQLFHLNFHNGTIWRWIRPVVSIGKEPHLRIEFRVLPAGPTVIDMIANVAFYLGCLHYYTHDVIPPESQLPFKNAFYNFYKASKWGMECSFRWLNKTKPSAEELIVKELIPKAKIGLERFGLSKKTIESYLNIIKDRATSHRTGSRWQREFCENHKHDINYMLEMYSSLQSKDIPVHLWPLR